MNPENIYPRTNDHATVYLKNVIKNPNILVGDFTMYNDFVHDPRQFEKNNVLYHYPINHDKLIIGKFCSIACGAKFLFTSANHTQASLSSYPYAGTTDEETAMKESSGKYKPPPLLSVIEAARAGEADAMEQILQHYDAYINKLCLRTMVDESGQTHKQVDPYMKGRLQSKLMQAITKK